MANSPVSECNKQWRRTVSMLCIHHESRNYKRLNILTEIHFSKWDTLIDNSPVTYTAVGTSTLKTVAHREPIWPWNARTSARTAAPEHFTAPRAPPYTSARKSNGTAQTATTASSKLTGSTRVRRSESQSLPDRLIDRLSRSDSVSYNIEAFCDRAHRLESCLNEHTANRRYLTPHRISASHTRCFR